MVTRCTDVRPLMTVAAYTCEQCGYEIYQEVKNKVFMPLMTCPAPMCATNKVNGRIHLQTRASKMVKYQEVKVQELANQVRTRNGRNSNGPLKPLQGCNAHTRTAWCKCCGRLQVPMGQVPRAITVQAWGDLTRQCKPGDTVNITGIFMPTPFTGYRGSMNAGRQLIADTFIKATDIQQLKKSYDDYQITDEMKEKIAEMAEQTDTYSNLGARNSVLNLPINIYCCRK